ncbi:phosphoribosylpyrophosphate synthetase [Pedobacter sp. UYEF25]
MKGLEHMGEMKTLSEVIDLLVGRGYTYDFNIENNKTYNNLDDIRKSPQNFLIDGFYRFEGASDPEDEAIVYAISSIDGTIKGVLVNGYGPSSDAYSEELIGKLKKKAKHKFLDR